jgi:hypothetical protein
MDLESSSFSTADYSFHQDPPDHINYDVNNITPNFKDAFDSSTKCDSEIYTCLSLRTLATWYFSVHFDRRSVIEIEFDAGVTPPCANLPAVFECGQSLLNVDSIRSFDLKDTVLYPVPGNYREKGALKSCIIYDSSTYEYNNFYENRIPFYRTIKFNHLYKLYSFWNTNIQGKQIESGGVARFFEAREHIDCPTHRIRLQLSTRLRNYLGFLTVTVSSLFASVLCSLTKSSSAPVFRILLHTIHHHSNILVTKRIPRNG